MLEWTEADISTPHTSIPAEYLGVVERVHFQQQTGPTTVLLQPIRVGKSFAVECATLDKESITLQQPRQNAATLLLFSLSLSLSLEVNDGTLLLQSEEKASTGSSNITHAASSSCTYNALHAMHLICCQCARA